MIISASRRTDIPALYSQWFLNRLAEGYVLTCNPMNSSQIRRVPLTKDSVDCIVFWSKNPHPMLEHLHLLEGYAYYFQFTLTPYGADIEPGLPPKRKLISVFQELSERLGMDRVIWRYDPILFTKTYSLEFHLKEIARMARELAGKTSQCVISFVDPYMKKRKNFRTFGIEVPALPQIKILASEFSKIASCYGMVLQSCAEELNLEDYGIFHGACIDGELIERITGKQFSFRKDKNQRPACYCVESVDIGVYNSCSLGCRYCYANGRDETILANVQNYSLRSPLLCGRIPDNLV